MYCKGGAQYYEKTASRFERLTETEVLDALWKYYLRNRRELTEKREKCGVYELSVWLDFLDFIGYTI